MHLTLILRSATMSLQTVRPVSAYTCLVILGQAGVDGFIGQTPWPAGYVRFILKRHYYGLSESMPSKSGAWSCPEPICMT